MGKFVEFHAAVTGERLLINLDWVTCVGDHEGKGEVVFPDGNTQYLMESYERTKLIVGVASGGIPMEPSREYRGS